MKPLQAGAIELDRCTFCRGLWFDGGELEKVLNKRLIGELVKPDERARKCPTCNVNLGAVVLGNVQVDACTTCRGVFLDDGELVALNGGQKVRVEAGAPPPPPRSDAEVKDDVMGWLDSLGA